MPGPRSPGGGPPAGGVLVASSARKAGLSVSKPPKANTVTSVILVSFIGCFLLSVYGFALHQHDAASQPVRRTQKIKVTALARPLRPLAPSDPCPPWCGRWK